MNRCKLKGKNDSKKVLGQRKKEHGNSNSIEEWYETDGIGGNKE